MTEKIHRTIDLVDDQYVELKESVLVVSRVSLEVGHKASADYCIVMLNRAQLQQSNRPVRRLGN